MIIFHISICNVYTSRDTGKSLFLRAVRWSCWPCSSYCLHPTAFYEESPSKHFVLYESTACLWSSSPNRRARSWAKCLSAAPDLSEREGVREGPRWVGGGRAVCLLQFSDLPPYRWLPLFAYSVNYYRKAVYLGCSPTLLHILWPIIKGDLHYKPWSPSKKATATVSASRLIPQLQHYLSTPSCFVSLLLSFCLRLSHSLSTSSSHSLPFS